MVDEATAQQVLEMTIESGDEFTVYQGDSQRLSVAGMAGITGPAAHKLNAKQVITHEDIQ